MDKIVIIEGLDQVYLEKRYEGKMRDFEGTGSKVVKYGAATLAFGVLGTALMYIYRRKTDKCESLCGARNNKCYNQCYANACKAVIAKIDEEINKAKQIAEPSRTKRIVRLQKERQEWVEKLNKYNTRVAAQS